jgi:hypothetical protein
MSAVNVLVRKSSVEVWTDGLQYDAYGLVHGITDNKAFEVPGLGMVMASLGPANAAKIFAEEIARDFRSFDDVIAGIEAAMPDYFDNVLPALQRCGFSDCELYFVGVRRGRAEAYCMKVFEPDSAEHWADLSRDSGLAGAGEAFRLVELVGIAGNPPPTDDEFLSGGLIFYARSVAELVEVITPLDMVHLMEIQRRRKEPFRAGFPPAHFVGGMAVRHVIRDDGAITKTVERTWPEDQVGQIVTPRIEDDKKLSQSATVCAPDGLSRLQREMWMKKQAKAARRAGAR